MTSHDHLFDTLHDFFVGCSSTGDADAVDHFVELELTLSQVKAIFVLAHAEEPLPINVLADRIRLSVAAAGRMVDGLVATGMVQRHENPADRRVKLVTVTSTGHAAAAAHINAKKAAMRAQIDRLTDTQAEQLVDALQPLLHTHPLDQEIPA